MDPRSTWDSLRPPRPPHGQRLLISQIDLISREEPDRPWIAVPVDESDLTQGYQNITFRQFANAVNSTAHWLRGNLGLPSTGFPSFAYTGPPDCRYAIFAAAAAKLGYQIIPFGRTIEAAGQQKIAEQKGCTTYLHAQGSESVVQEVQRIDPRVRTILAPELQAILRGSSCEPIVYSKTWEEARHDPWLVLHTSGTTGFPKFITYSQQQLSTADVVMGLEDDIGDTNLLLYANSRFYLPMAPMHYVSMFMTLGASVWARAVPVYGPGGVTPSSSIVKAILKHGQLDGAILVPALITDLCEDPESLEFLRKLKYIQYAGAPLSATSGKLLSSKVRVVPMTGSTEAGGYFVQLPNTTEDWNYVSMQPHTGAVMEHRVDDMYELVFIRHPHCAVQPIFRRRPELERFETKDLWVEHPTKKGQWRLIGRSDDLIKLTDGTGAIVAPIEAALREHHLVKNALVGGHGKPKPFIVIEPVATKANEVITPQGKTSLIEELKSHIEKVNFKCHEPAKLDTRLIVFATPDRPWPLTMKNTPVRSQVLKMHERDIEAAYQLYFEPYN